MCGVFLIPNYRSLAQNFHGKVCTLIRSGGFFDLENFAIAAFAQHFSQFEILRAQAGPTLVDIIFGELNSL